MNRFAPLAFAAVALAVAAPAVAQCGCATHHVVRHRAYRPTAYVQPLFAPEIVARPVVVERPVYVERPEPVYAGRFGYDRRESFRDSFRSGERRDQYGGGWDRAAWRGDGYGDSGRFDRGWEHARLDDREGRRDHDRAW